ncbi:hypothetical protein RBB78_10130 [Tunturiibacter empetritectus]|uniref:hypothetical protein n=1 Tax=Tunturiibacter empetritectus TaxID=3069691 RepID=UPI003D9B3736
MGIGWAHIGTSITASFLASLVECVEALTVVLAVGSVRGWRSALIGSASAIAVLLLIIAALGTALTHIPLHILQLTVGTLLLLFGLRWLRKAILRAAGLIPFTTKLQPSRRTPRPCVSTATSPPPGTRSPSPPPSTSPCSKAPRSSSSSSPSVQAAPARSSPPASVP